MNHSTPAENLRQRIEVAMRCDQFRLRRQLQRLLESKPAGDNGPVEGSEALVRLAERIEASVARRDQREASIPRLEYADDLPITAHREEIVQLLRTRQTIVVCGETGSGKSTQLPKLCLEAGLGRGGLIGHTQPRRLAARSIATRLAEELGTRLGDRVGFKIRFDDRTAPETLVKLMTDGILLAETQRDRFLDAYDAVILDEAHERSLNIDFLLGYLRRLSARRPELRIVITSATIDAARFAQHFTDEGGPAPVVNVEGRGFPVEMRYRPWEEIVVGDDSGPAVEPDLPRHVIAAVDEVIACGPGDTLVFLPTERDIREISHRVAAHLQRRGLDRAVEILPLYARLPSAEQQRIFNPRSGARRIVFATNVAESSLTVPGIRYVIDAGTARISRYSPRSKVQRLPIEAVSRASADQRAGRCGRIGPGICLRLYSEADYLAREPYTTPEIRRTNLASVILQTKHLRLGPIEEFPFLDPPRSEAVREGLRTLNELGALDASGELTPIGRSLAALPVDPRVGRMVLAAADGGVLPEVLVIAAALEVQDPRDRPPDRRQAADEAHRRFTDPQSDFVSYLRLWRFFHHLRDSLSRTQLRKALRQNFLSHARLLEWSDVHRQLRQMVREQTGGGRSRGKRSPRSQGESSSRPVAFPAASPGADSVVGSAVEESPAEALGIEKLGTDGRPAAPLLDPDRYGRVHQALLSGLLSGVAQGGERHEYTGAGGLQLFLWPGSGVFEAKPKWIVAAELIETTRRYARTVARIDPEWLERIGAHLVRRSYSDPHWSRKANGAFCYERVTLFGLPIVARRRVPLAPVDPATARELLIEQGLVEDQLVTRARLVQHNRRLREALAALAAKTRRRELVVDPYALQRFYQERLPEEIVDRARLERFDRDHPPPSWTRQLSDAAGVARWIEHVEAPPARAEPTAAAGERSEEEDGGGADAQGADAEGATPYMRPEDLVPQLAESLDPAAFPDQLDVGGTQLPLAYHYEPGAERDGITVTVPRAALGQVSDERLGWLVPGLLETKLIALIKALPKRIRRNLVPAAEVARAVAGEVDRFQGEVPFFPTVCAALSRHAEMTIAPHDFDAEKLPPHLAFFVEVVDDQGQPVAAGRSVAEVRTALGIDVSEAAGGEEEAAGGEAPEDPLARDGLTSFDLEELPEQVMRVRGGVRVAQYPALLDRGDSVAVRVLGSAAAAERATRDGLTRLFALAERKELRSQARWLPDADRARMLLAPIVSASRFEQAMIELLARLAFVEGECVCRTREAFDQRRSERGRRIAVAAQEIGSWLPQLAEGYQAARAALEGVGGSLRAHATDDITAQLERLTADDFLRTTPWRWLRHYPRYFRAIAYRLDKLSSGALQRDAQATETVAALQRRLSEMAGGAPADWRTLTDSAADEEVRWLIEELRVSLFAQPLGTAEKVSPQRIEKLLRASPETRKLAAQPHR